MLHVVTGAGPVGTTLTEQLVAAGHEVRVVTRSGSGPDLPGVSRVAADASDPAAMERALDGATAVFHCAHTAYDLRAWERDLPAMEQAVLHAAGGRVVVFPESLYAFDSSGVMTETTPTAATAGKRGVRSRLLAARAASSTPTVSVAASDFVGPHVRNAHAGERMLAAVLAGKRVQVLGSADTPHAFTYVPDLAAAMITAAEQPQLWDSVLLAPTGPALTQRQLVQALCEVTGTTSRVSEVPDWVVRAGGLVNRQMRELAETLYQLTQPFLVDSSRSEAALGLEPTPLAEQLEASVRWFRGAELSRR